MTRWVSFFKPSYSSLISNMDANETARFLMEQNTPIPDKQKHFKAIRAMSRTLGQPLKSILSELHARARGYYADEQEGNRPTLINNLMLQGLQAFTAGTTNEMLRKAIQQSIMENEPLQWDRIMETAVKSEENSGSPMTTLFFFPSNQVSFFNTQVFHNTIHPNVNPLVPPRGPQVRPLVHMDRRLQQQYYSTDYNQWQPHENAFYNMQDPLMPVQPVFPMNQVAPPPAPVVPQPAPPIPQVNLQQQLLDQQQAEQIVANQAAVQAQQRAVQEQQRLQQEHDRILREQAAMERILEEQRAAQAQAEQAIGLQVVERQDPVTPQQALLANMDNHARQNQAGAIKEFTPPPTEPKDYQLRDTAARLGAIQKKAAQNLINKMKNNNIIPDVGSPVSIPTDTLATTVLLTQMQQMQEQLNQIAAVNSTIMQPARITNQVANAQPYMPRGQTPPRQNRDQRENRNNGSRPNSPGYRPNSPGRNYGNQNQRSYTPNRDGRRDQRSSYNDRNRSQSPYRRDNRQNRGRSMSPGYRRNDYNRSNNSQRSNSQNRYSRPNSPANGYRSNQQRDNRNRSPSPYQQNRQRQPERTNQIILGVNCNPNYNKSQGQLCTKCNSFGRHDEPNCPNYYHWAPKSCATCHNGFHTISECLRTRQPSPGRNSPAPDGMYRKN
jgi:hypothetical protein